MELIEVPKIGRKLPDTLSVDEIDRLIAAIEALENSLMFAGVNPHACVCDFDNNMIICKGIAGNLNRTLFWSIGNGVFDKIAKRPR